MAIAQNGRSVDSDNEVLFERISESVALVTLNRPAVRNAVTPTLAANLEKIVIEVESDEAIRVAILTGSGDKAFCAGADLREVAAGRLDACFTAGAGFAGFVNARRAKPWIAAVNGHALAGGFEMVLACDLVVAADQATFGLPEVTRGLIASAGGLYRLPRILPRPLAMELIATGKSVTADRALNLGLVNRVVPCTEVLREALQIALTICDNAPLAVRESVRIARLASGFDDALLRSDAEQTQGHLQSTDDYQEGAQAFIEKRSPQWEGR
jgi:enoyl-CoA hydratase/carnithine racemase